VTCVKRPARSPRSERVRGTFVLSIKSEYLWKIIPLGKRHHCRAVAELIEHYHGDRNHQDPLTAASG